MAVKFHTEKGTQHLATSRIHPKVMRREGLARDGVTRPTTLGVTVYGLRHLFLRGETNTHHHFMRRIACC